jgi:hypothetical protein
MNEQSLTRQKNLKNIQTLQKSNNIKDLLMKIDFKKLDLNILAKK